MSQSNEYLMRMRQNTYGSSGNQNNSQNPNANNPNQNQNQNQNTQPNTNQNQPPNNQQVEPDSSNSCDKLICESWNLTLLVVSILTIAMIAGLLIAYK